MIRLPSLAIQSVRMLAMLLALGLAQAIAPPPVRAADVAAACSAMASTGNSSISSARALRLGELDVCALSGRATDATRFELLLPASGWNGKFVQLACHGDCASPASALCDNVVRRGFACLAASRSRKPFAPGDAPHALAVAAKDAVARFYGKPVATSLLLGCGEGSHDALVEAQQYPQDFNAIVASAPVIDAEVFAQDLRARLELLRAGRGRGALTKDDLQTLHRAALAKCDADDGLQDGLISQPLRCGFDPRGVACGSAPQGQCLSAAAVDVAAKMYAGDKGLLPGSELQWAALLKPNADLQRWSSLTMKRGAVASAVPMAAAPKLQLADFIAARGKLLLVQGLADAVLSPRRALRSYEAFVEANGGLVKTQGAVRLFAVPGLAQCGAGEGTNRINLLSIIDTWSNGRAPDDFIAFRALEPAAAEHPFAPLPLDAAQAVYGGWMLGNPVTLEQARELSGTAFSRPVFLYPYRAQYKGRGDPKLWMSFFAPGDFTLLSNPARTQP